MPGRARFTAVAVIAGGAACLAGVGYAAGLVHFKHSSATSAQYPPSKVTICHHTHSQHNPFVTITVSEHALPAHLRHGDTVGACSEQQGSTETEAGKPKKEKLAHQNHGKSAAAHARKAEKESSRADAKAGKSNNGKALGHGKSGVHGKGHGQNTGQAKGHGQGKGKGHDKNTSHGNGQGPGHGQGHDPGGDHGNSGGGKGNSHKR
jgi:hypothetical protein